MLGSSPLHPKPSQNDVHDPAAAAAGVDPKQINGINGHRVKVFIRWNFSFSFRSPQDFSSMQ